MAIWVKNFKFLSYGPYDMDRKFIAIRNCVMKFRNSLGRYGPIKVYKLRMII